MKRIIPRIIVGLLLISILTLASNIRPGKATPTTITVPDDYPTIQAAVNAASAGDTIYVRNGMYYEHITLNKTLALIGESRNAIVDGNGIGNIFTVIGSNASIAGFSIRNGSCGIHIEQPGMIILDATIANNTIQNCNEGIKVSAPPGGFGGETSFSAVNNSIINNSLGIGIDNEFFSTEAPYECVSGNITGNLFLNNTIGISGGACSSMAIRNNLILFSTKGIELQYTNVESYYPSASFCNSTNNRIFGNKYGIFFYGHCSGSNISFSDNKLDRNEYAAYIYYEYEPYASSDTWHFYHNDFVNNTQEAFVYEAPTEHGPPQTYPTMTWDNGYPSGGNYWSDYQTKYPNATEIDSSGIWNTPYVINENNTDYYPFMQSLPISIPAPSVQVPPVAHFSYSPNAPVVNQTVTFNAWSSGDLNGTIVSYAWDFGDGNYSTSTQPTITHAYSSVGTYNVTLTVTDNYGLTDVDVKNVSVGKLNSTISIQASPTTITIGKSTRISGSITPSRPEANATIYDMLNGEGIWSVLANVTTDANSTYYYTWAPTQPGNYLLKANWTGDQYTLSAETPMITLDCMKIVTSISISTSSSSTIVGFSIGIAGRLTDEYGNGLTNEVVVLYYATYGVNTWNLITSDATDAFGNYSAVWVPSATGTFTIKAEWAGNSTDSGASRNVTLGCVPYKDQYVFSVESNSTISELVFNTTSMELSFTASGPSGTRGYTRVTVAKSLVANATNIKVYLDGNQLNYSIASTDDSWLLTFNYTHSTHKVAVDLNAATIPEIPSITLLLLLMLLTMLVAIIVGKRNKAYCPELDHSSYEKSRCNEVNYGFSPFLISIISIGPLGVVSRAITQLNL
jgi:PKD repeat protein